MCTNCCEFANENEKKTFTPSKRYSECQFGAREIMFQPNPSAKTRKIMMRQFTTRNTQTAFPSFSITTAAMTMMIILNKFYSVENIFHAKKSSEPSASIEEVATSLLLPQHFSFLRVVLCVFCVLLSHSSTR